MDSDISSDLQTIFSEGPEISISSEDAQIDPALCINDDEPSQEVVVLPNVVYPECESHKMVFSQFPLQKQMILSLPTSALIEFLRCNNVEEKQSHENELLLFKIEQFLDGKKKDSFRDTLDTSKETNCAGDAPLPLDEADDELVTELMLLELGSEEVSAFKNLKVKPAAEIKDLLLLYGVEVDSTLTKNQLLEKFYLVLSENSRAEKGLDVGEKQLKQELRNHPLVLVNECCICLENKLKSCIFPCGHIVLCDVCAAKVTLCPMCRGEVEKVMPVYFS